MGVFQEVISREWVLLNVVLVPRSGNSAIWDVGSRKDLRVENSTLVL